MPEIDIESEDVIDMKEAARHPAFRNARTRKPASIASVWRWVTRGARDANGSRVRLQTFRSPGGLRTSREAIARFISRLTDPGAPMPTSARRKREQSDAVRELTEAGY